jgi:hypothetical protein
MCFAAYTPYLFAQGSDLGTIRGVVTDSSGALIPDAQVQITNLGNLQVFSFKTDARGSYEAPALVPGRYKAVISAVGFSTTTVNGIVLNGSDVAQGNAVLRPASQTVNVEVTSEALGIDTDNSTLSTTLSNTAVIDLPRDSRDIYQFLYINPDVTQGSGGNGTFKALGTQSYGASFTVDGQSSTGGIFGGQTQSQPSLEAVGELNVLSNAFSAQYAGVINVRINTKSGGSQNHGSLFYNNENSALAATPLDSTKTRSNQTQFGGSWGGPIPKVKNTFFFMAYEFSDDVAPIFENNQTGVLNPAVQGGDFSALNACADPPLSSIEADTPNQAIPAGLQMGTCNPSSGAPYPVITGVPSSSQNPITAKLVDLYFPKLANNAQNAADPLTGRIPLFSTTETGANKQHMGDLRIDHNFNDANRIYGVYHGSAQDNATSPVSRPYSGLGLLNTFRNNSTLSLSYTHVFSPRMVNELRGGYNIQNEYLHSNTSVQGFLQSIGFSADDITAYGSVVQPTVLSMYGNTNITFGSSGITSFGDGSRSSDRNENQDLITFGDSLTWTVGRHSLTFGGDFVRNDAKDGFSQTRNTPQGTLAYSGSGLVPYVNFLLGNAPTRTTFVAIPRPALDVSNWENGYYVQDDFRVTPKLTLNLGMRYDSFTPFVDKNDIMANFDPNYRNTSTGQVGRYIIPSKKTLQYLQYTVTDPPPDGIGYVLAADSGLGVGRGLVRPDRQDFGPRVGWAYSVSSKSVVRGGFGLYYPSSSAHIIRDPLTTNTFNASETKTSSSATPLSAWPRAVEAAGTAPNVGGSISGFGNFPSANYVPVNIKNPRLMEWNATFEQQMPWQMTLRASYIGGHQQGQIIGNDLDMINASDNPFGTTQGIPSSGTQSPNLGYTGTYSSCDPYNDGDCNYSAADDARITFPALGDFVTGFGNHGKSMTNSIQIQGLRQAKGLTFSLAYTYLNQKSSAMDVGDDSLGGDNYDPFVANYDYTRDSFVSTNRVVGYAIYDLPFGHGQHFAANSPRLEDAIIGGWQLSTNMFAKSGVGFTPTWGCGDCDPVMAGNIASGAEDAVGDFSGLDYRANILGNPYGGRQKGFQYAPFTTDAAGNPNGAFGYPDLGATYWSNPLVAKRNFLNGPGTWGVNLGIHKMVHVNNRIAVELGADFDNVFNHPLLSPPSGDSYANLGTLFMLTPASVDGVSDGTVLPNNAGAVGGAAQPALQPFNSVGPGTQGVSTVQLNPSFGQNNTSYSQEGVSGNRQIRLIGRITF